MPQGLGGHGRTQGQPGINVKDCIALPFTDPPSTVARMADLTPEGVRVALRAVLFPNFRRDIVTLGMVSDVRVDGGVVTVELRPGTDDAAVLEQLAARTREVVERLPGVTGVHVLAASAAQGRGKDPFAGRAALPGVQHVVAVASTKGGVGKSTVAVNLALALAERTPGRVGLADMDVYGPSLPLMLGVSERPRVSASRRIEPVERHGLKLMSMGFFLDEQSPVIWRGPIVMGIVRQFLHDVDWAPLEFLVVDLPPGTGDAPLTLVQQVPVAGGVVVTTPQDVAILDVGRGIAMFGQVSTPVLGIVENMAGYVCPKCGTEDAVFGAGGADRLAERAGVPLLARIPLAPAIRDGGDQGRPIVLADPAHPASAAFRTLATRVADAVRSAPRVTVAGVSA
jgi:ATP-binding protein involved in chromosome partitioning